MELTQGTIISGVRSKKYPTTICNAIIISAKCDLANCKITQVYYVIALPFDDWLLSEEGFRTAMSGKIKNMEDNLKSQTNNAGLDWDTLKTFSNAELEKVISDKEVGVRKNAREYMEGYLQYQKYQRTDLTDKEKRQSLLKEKNTIKSCLQNIMAGKHTHYVYLPKNAYRNSQSPKEGILVDLQELDRFDIKTAKIISNFNMDSQSGELTEAEKEIYNKQFFIKDKPGYATSEGRLESPWIEYLMQHFANSFIRIGVEGVDGNEAVSMLERICKEEET